MWLEGPARLRLNPRTRRVFVGERQLELTRTSFDILAVLLFNRDVVVTTPDLIREVWGYEQSGGYGFAYTAVYRLRKDLARAGAPDLIESVRGVGFRIPAVSGEPAVEFALDPEARRTLEAASTAIVLQGRDRRVLWANPAAVRLTGYSMEELIALPSGEALSPGDQRELRSQFWLDVLGGEERRHSEVPIKRRDGHTVLVNGVWKAVCDEDGEFQYAMLELWMPISEAESSAVLAQPAGAVA